ncbi:unnamed protein product [Microthlaspi erraticum]|uniref:Uncharacterized protein n=1 Tax=Microthlaspi erraticum TaxID=1685480 RepID=A0A6D2ILF2_9BRAS|nr:unnamed protein product [Microthlaspi erraticum]
MNGKKKVRSIFDNCRETASQESFLRRCGFAQRGVPPDSDPSLNDGIASHRAASETESLNDSGYDEDLVESHAIRFVSPPESADTVDLEEDATDRTVPVESEVGDSIALEKSGDPSSSGRRRLESLSKEDGGKKKKLKVPLRDVVKAIVMNSRNPEDEDKEIEKMSCVQILMKKGFKFPGVVQNPSKF